MRLKLVLFLFFISSSVLAQNYMAVRSVKDSLDGFMPFYDTHEKEIKVMISLSQAISSDSQWLTYSIQPKSNKNTLLEIYSDTIHFDKHNFDYAVPINDTFLKSGNYRLAFSLLNKSNDALLDEKDLFFQALRAPNNYYKSTIKEYKPLVDKRVVYSVSNIDVSKTFVHKYDAKRMRNNIEALSAITDRAEQGGLESILLNNNLEEMQRFFYNFWYGRNPQNPEAEWKLYAEKLNYVSRAFAFGAYKGYETDRGQLYLRYGPPNREVRMSNERGTKPYEVWFYNELDKHTNLNILFVQIGTLVNEKIMIHSSDPNFFFNPQWTSQLFTDMQEVNNKNAHRVYDFFK